MCVWEEVGGGCGWPLVRGKLCLWDHKEVAGGRIRGLAVDEG